ncbi:MAG: 50S ribosomal protein L30e [Candidatus Bathyarchaeota archaeon]|nr:MAG: 50S ribosomal protein L30e [Candidatus Bathyarchaeota archaeon]
MIDVDRAISNAVKTGKVAFGLSEAMRSAKNGKARMIVLASYLPSRIRENLEYYTKLSQTPLFVYKGRNVDLGMICKKRFAVAALTVKEFGDSDMQKLIEKPRELATSQEETDL